MPLDSISKPRLIVNNTPVEKDILAGDGQRDAQPEDLPLPKREMHGCLSNGKHDPAVHLVRGGHCHGG